MMLRKSKKGLIFFPFITIFTVIVLIVALTILSSKTKTISEGLGKNQIEIFKSYQEGEKLLLYLDESAKLSARQAAVQLAASGGFENNSDCGKSILMSGLPKTVNLWNNQSKALNCRPDYKKDYISLIDNGVKVYLNEVNSLKNINFEYYVNNNTIVSSSGKELSVPVKKEDGTSVGLYKKYPSFNVNIGYNVDEYEDLFKEADNLLQTCYNNTNLLSCVKNNSKWANFNCNQVLQKCSFEVYNGKKFFVYDGQKMVEREITYEFGLFFG